MIFGIIMTYLVLGFVVGLLSKESEFDEGWRALLWFVGWPVLGIIVNRRKDAKYYDFDEHEMVDLGLYNKQLDILNKSIEEHLREKYDIPKIEIPDECVGCMFGKRFVNDGDEDNILVCLKCRRTYVEGSECYEEYPDRYIKEEK